MSQMRKTIIFCAVAVVLAALAFLAAPKKVTPEAFLDQGQPFFPEFTDPNVARTLEVIGFNEQTGSAVPFKVTFEKGMWTIPSHHNYPADAKDRLAKTAAGVIELKKDDFRTDNASDHEACGVVDPLDTESASLAGRGQRVTVKGENDVVLADLIIGKPVEGRDKMRFVRIPGQKRVYTSRVDVDISTKFADWIETDLLQANKDEMDHIVLRNYSINERTGKVDERDRVVLEKHGEWTMPGIRGRGNRRLQTQRLAGRARRAQDRGRATQARRTFSVPNPSKWDPLAQYIGHAVAPEHGVLLLAGRETPLERGGNPGAHGRRAHVHAPLRRGGVRHGDRRHGGHLGGR
jgi:hypothetical protein